MSGAQDLLLQGIDFAMSLLPQERPSQDKLDSLRLVAHRGAHDAQLKENTWEAFRRAIELNMWGIELDVRWSQDDVPLVMHDPLPARVFPHLTRPISECKAQIFEKEDSLPFLESLIQELGSQIHLMLEIKEPLSTSKKKRKLKELLRNLEPKKDFHILSLVPEWFESLEGLPTDCFLPVAEWNFPLLSRRARHEGWAGVSGHYLLTTSAYISSHHKINQKVGTGFIASQNVLYRELNRGVDWLFTDHAELLKSILDKDSSRI